MKFPKKKYTNIDSFLNDYSDTIKKGYDSVDRQDLENIASLLANKIKHQSKILCCGNGGSSAIAEHFVCDFVKGVSTNTTLVPIIHSLTSNVPILTAIANDISYEESFSYQLRRYGSEGDILICISSSGNSPNIIRAIEEAQRIGMQVISLVGFDGGQAKKLSDYTIHVDVHNYGVVEDIHQSFMHILAQYIRLKYLESEDITSINF